MAAPPVAHQSRSGAGARILITGFGPFPGVPDNLSARLARELARQTAAVWAVLPTEWDTAWKRLRLLLQHERPDIVIHFGVSRTACGFCLERRAYNEVHPMPDACGRLPGHRQVRPGGRERLDVTLSYDSILHALREHALPARCSDDPGRYLCNFVLYNTLDWLQTAARPVRAGFVHIPQTAVEQREGGSAVTFEALLLGGRIIVAQAVENIRAGVPCA